MMRKAWTIAWKDLLLAYRDPLALVLMLAAPLALTLVISAAFGGASSGGGPEKIPVILVDQDQGQFSALVVEAFQSPDLAELISPLVQTDPQAARQTVDADQAAAAVIIPSGFSTRILPDGAATGQPKGEVQASAVEIYANPSRSIGAGVVRSITDSILNHLSGEAVSGKVIIQQLLTSGRITPEQVPQWIQLNSQHTDQPAEEEIPVRLKVHSVDQPDDPWQNFNWLRYSAASMAILYLMFTMTASARTILAERESGTLPRMLTSPTPSAAVLGGKMLGAYLTGLVQMFVLIVAARILFGMDWGDPFGVILLTILLVAAVTGWAMIPAAVAKTPGQANTIGTALTLSFAGLAGNFVPRTALPEWLRSISLITPNAWGLEGYTALLAGQGIADIAWMLFALLVMAVVMFSIAVLVFRRQYIV